LNIKVEMPDNFGDQLVQTLVRYNGKVTEEVANVINQGLLEIETRAKLESPVDTGRLRSSIHAVAIGKTDNFRYSDNEGNSFDGALSDAGKSGNEGVGYVGTNVEYAPEQEFGGGEGKKGGHKFLTRATAEMTPKIESALKKIRVSP
jgi:phage gpG-like protein